MHMFRGRPPKIVNACLIESRRMAGQRDRGTRIVLANASGMGGTVFGGIRDGVRRSTLPRRACRGAQGLKLIGLRPRRTLDNSAEQMQVIQDAATRPQMLIELSQLVGYKLK